MNIDDIGSLVGVRALLASGEARARREAAFISTGEVAAALGVRPETVWRWETGRRQPMAEDALAYGELLYAATATIGADGPRTARTRRTPARSGPYVGEERAS